MKKVSFVIPCYRSELSIEIVLEEIKNAMMQYKGEYEIILVNDCSPDNVWKVIQNYVKNNSNVFGINLARNFGQHAALMAGYSFATGDIIVSMDDDGQTPIEEVHKLFCKLEEGYDVVFAEYEEIKQNKFRIWGSRLNEKMTEYLVNKPKNIKPTSFFVVRRFVVEEMLRYQCAYPYIGGLIFRATQNIANVKVKHRDRLYGQSGYKLSSLITMWINGFTAFSVKPLRIATIVGLFCALVGLLFGIYVIVSKILVPEIAMGYSSIMTVLLFMGGIIMMLLGLIGEYLGRIYICINNAPQYVIRNVVKKKEE